jgi:hypothetical protein
MILNDLSPFSEPQQSGDVADEKSDLSAQKQSDVADVADQRRENDAEWERIKAEHAAKRRGHD